jgi:tRNA nucleotidyltransferase/poly(A) polymerase
MVISLEYLQQEIFEILREHLLPDERLFLVGGAVRDLLLGKTPEDVDFVIKGDAKKLSRSVANQVKGAVYQLDDEHAAMRVLSDCGLFKGRIDIGELRGESLEEDLCDRDFTINAMAIDITDGENLDIIDPCHGQRDVQKGLIRVCSADSIISDPIRILRGIRLALAFGFAIDNETKQQMKQPTILALASAERKRDEFFKIFEPNLATDGFDLLSEYDLLPFLLPGLGDEKIKGAAEFVRHLSVVIQTANGQFNAADDHITGLKAALLPYQGELSAYLDKDIVEGRKRAVLLFFAVLAWLSIGEQDTKAAAGTTKKLLSEFCERFALSNREMNFLRHIIENRDRVYQLTANAVELDGKNIYRFFRETGESGIGLCLLSLAQGMASESDDSDANYWPRVVLVCQQLVDHYFTRWESTIHPQILITGDDLITVFSLTPGPLFQTVLEAVREEQAAGNVNNREDAFSLVKALLREKNKCG